MISYELCFSVNSLCLFFKGIFQQEEGKSDFFPPRLQNFCELDVHVPEAGAMTGGRIGCAISQSSAL